MRMLSPEERLRIETEERKRYAEEQYRAQVKSALLSSGKNEGSDSSTPVIGRARRGKLLAIGIVVVLGAIVAMNFLQRSSVLHPFREPLMPPRVVAGPLRTTYWRFHVNASTVNARVV